MACMHVRDALIQRVYVHAVPQLGILRSEVLSTAENNIAINLLFFVSCKGGGGGGGEGGRRLDKAEVTFLDTTSLGGGGGVVYV